MSKNPIVPYILIFSLGIGLIFFLSLHGVGQKNEIANQGENGQTEDDVAAEADFDPEVAIGKCVGCHGGELEGGMGGEAPTLLGLDLSKDEIVTILKEGIGIMPAEVIPASQAEEMAEYLLTLD